MKIRIKNESCIQSGLECGCDADEQCGDCDEVEVSEAQAVEFEVAANASHGGHGAYLRRCANTVRAAAGALAVS